MAVTKAKIEQAMGENNILSFSPEHEKQQDVWVVNITDEAINFSSTKYKINLGVQFSLLPDTKSKDKLKKEIENRLVFFIKGLEAGVEMTKKEVQNGLDTIFTSHIVPINSAAPVEEEESDTSELLEAVAS